MSEYSDRLHSQWQSPRFAPTNVPRAANAPPGISGQAHNQPRANQGRIPPPPQARHEQSVRPAGEPRELLLATQRIFL